MDDDKSPPQKTRTLMSRCHASTYSGYIRQVVVNWEVSKISIVIKKVSILNPLLHSMTNQPNCDQK